MKEEISFCTFCDRFREMNRDNNFSYEGKKALFEFLEEYEEQTGKEIEFDVIALCCDYNEYKNIKEYLENYSSDVDRKDYEENDDLEGYEEAVLKEIGEKTTLIKIDDEAFIIQAY